MALVIFCVALVAAMRTRMSLRLAMLRRRTTEDGGRTDRKFPSGANHRSPILRPPCSDKSNVLLSECLGESFNRALELRGRGIAEIAGLADIVEDIGVPGAQRRQQAVLERPHPRERNRIEVGGDLGLH